MTIKYNIERNPLLTHSYTDEEGVEVTTTFLCIGDPHFGKRFITGVPKHRVGERENNILAEFKRLIKYKADYIIIMGDLFDKFIVSPTVINTVYEALSDVTTTPIYIIPGNHDLSKDTTKTSSFTLFSKLVNSTLTNVKVIEKSELVQVNCMLYLYLDAYNPFSNKSLVPYDDISTINNKQCGCEVISFGHWDSMDLTDNGWMPSDELLLLSDLLISGHEHSYKEYTYPTDSTNTKVLFTGSMQPYSHAEDPDNDIYVTINYEDIGEYNLTTDFKYKCLRILCKSYFVHEEPIDCYSLTCKIVLPDDIEDSLSTNTEIDVENYLDTIKDWVKDNEDFDDTFKNKINQLIEEKSYL